MATDTFDVLRTRWEESITGGIGYDPADPDYARVISRITAAAQNNWDSMNKAGGRTYLWGDLQGTTNSAYVTQAYTRLNGMALALRTTGSSLAGNTVLRTDLLSALDWMYTNCYKTTSTGNWWDLQIGIPLQLNDITVLLYGYLTAQQRTNYMSVVDHFSPTVTGDAANRVWKALVVGVRGVIVKDSIKIASARDGLSPVLGDVTSREGFYADGSFIQHLAHPYTGSYGACLLQDIANLMYVLDGSTWQVTDPKVTNVYKWVHRSFEPLIYKGAMMDMTFGRSVSRYNFQNHVIGHQVTRAIIRLSQLAATVDATAYKRMVKEWIQTDTVINFYDVASMNMAILGKAILSDPGTSPRGGLSKNVQFNCMARAAHLRPGYAFGVSMHSNRIYNYEATGTENLRGWHTGDGMTYLYNGDQAHYSDAFWPTVNCYRLPGTTVEQNTTIPYQKGSDQSWVGGTELLGYGATGMAVHPYGQTLNGRKSWFMFDDEIVALGAGFLATDNKVVETIVENRKLNSAGSNTLTVNGAAKPSSIPWSETMTGVNWAHLTGTAAGSDIGYYFPGAPTMKGQREARTGAWSSINTQAPFVNPTPYTRRYLSLRFDHGNNPTNAGYSYVILPNKSAAQVASYAAAPKVTILRNDRSGQAVRHNSLRVTGANSWVDSPLQMGDILTDGKSSVVMKEGPTGTLDVAISDPMFLGAGSITIEISKAGGAAVAKDAAITVNRLTPAIRLTVNVAGLYGRSVKASFSAPVMYSKADFSGVYCLGRLNTGVRVVEYDVTPQLVGIDGVMGLTDTSTAIGGYPQLNMIVRAATTGFFDVMDSAAYRADTSIAYVPGAKYHVKIVANVPAGIYSVHVTPPGGGSATLIANDYAFRASAPAMNDIGKMVLKSTDDSDLKVENLSIG